MSDDGAQTPEFQFQTVGEKLKSSRERKGYSLSDIAQRTRIPLRHLEAIEQSEYTSLPGSTYTIGFAKAYARTTGLNDGEIATKLRAELERHLRETRDPRATGNGGDFDRYHYVTGAGGARHQATIWRPRI